jgi:hypothetical protein
VGVAYFYCDYKDPLKQSPTKVLSTLLHQLGKQSQTVFGNLQKFFEKQRQDYFGNSVGLDVLRSNFSSFVKDGFSHTYIVVDGLDETGDEYKCLASALLAIGKNFPADIKVIPSYIK